MRRGNSVLWKNVEFLHPDFARPAESDPFSALQAFGGILDGCSLSPQKSRRCADPAWLGWEKSV